jgi:hypothetical protein
MSIGISLGITLANLVLIALSHFQYNKSGVHGTQLLYEKEILSKRDTIV